METNIIYDLLGENWLGILIVCIIPLLFVLVYALLAILGELKIASFVQERLGPMRTGPWGIIQPVAEVVKLIQKEDIIPAAANKTLFNIAPYIMFIGAYAGFAVIPFSNYYAPSGLNLGVFYVLAVGSIAVIGIFMGGWASNNKYSILGAMRSAAQIVSYEIPAAIAILSIVVLAGTLNMQEINQLQAGGFWNWYLFGGPGPATKIFILPFTFALFLIYFVASLAETNRTPFDIPEGESEIVAGYHTEYSGMKFAMFFFAEYANMFIVAAVITILFLGGWQSPFGDFLNYSWLQPLWFIGKAFFFVFIQIWLRWTLPRLRVDQLMYMGWKVLVPWAFLCFLIISFYMMIK
jgi:NADH-quinone oxidoreductase subunit H